MNEFVKPTIEYAQLWPLLLVFGVACAGVLVEAFLPRRLRYVVQTVLTLAGLVAAARRRRLRRRRRSRSSATGPRAARSPPRAPSPSTARPLFLWGLILLFAIIGVLLFAERHLEGGVSAFAGQAAALPGSEAERRRPRPGSTTPRSTR